MIGDRLKEERARLGMSQHDFALAAGITRRPYAEWEAGRTSPNAVQLAGLGAKGVDIQYVVMGARSRDALTPEELMVLEHYRAADKKVRAAAIGALIAGEVPDAGPRHVEGALQIFKQAPTGTVVGRDLIKKKR